MVGRVLLLLGYVCTLGLLSISYKTDDQTYEIVSWVDFICGK